MRKLITLILMTMFLMTAVPVNAITVNPFTTKEALVNNIVDPTKVTVSNITYTGIPNASGTFLNGGASGLGFNQGILLTSGLASNVDSFNNSDGITGNNGLAGDANLESLIPGYITHDATVLEFDFQISATDIGDLYFNYIFGSDEYNEYTNTSFNDVFGFFLDGTNIALIPGTSIPVSVNNVNGGNPLGVNASYPEYYNNNDLNDGGPYFAFEYDGFTDVFQAKYIGLTPGYHHIKLAIADSGDWILDSGVFIQAGSFSSEPVPVPGAFLLGMLGLSVAGVKLRKHA